MPLLLILVSLGFYPATPALAAQIQPVAYSTTTAENIILSYAVKYGINGEEFLATAKCESGLKSAAVGDLGTSYGVFQLHLPAHPDISKEEALNPMFNIEWSAKQFAAGNQHIWSCYRLLFGGQSP